MRKGRSVLALLLLTCLFSWGMMVAGVYIDQSRRSFISYAERCLSFGTTAGQAVMCPHFERLISLDGVKLRGEMHTLSPQSLFVCDLFEEAIWRRD